MTSSMMDPSLSSTLRIRRGLRGRRMGRPMRSAVSLVTIVRMFRAPEWRRLRGLRVLFFATFDQVLKLVEVRRELADLVERHVERGHFIQDICDHRINCSGSERPATFEANLKTLKAPLLLLGYASDMLYSKRALFFRMQYAFDKSTYSMLSTDYLLLLADFELLHLWFQNSGGELRSSLCQFSTDAAILVRSTLPQW